MSTADDAREAALYALELLKSEQETPQAVFIRAAEDYGVLPKAVEAWVMRTFPDEQALETWRGQQRLAVQNRTARLEQLKGIEDAARDWAMGVWKACEPDGLPLWFYCCNRFLETNNIKNSEHRRAAHRVFAEVGTQYGAARSLYLEKAST